MREIMEILGFMLFLTLMFLALGDELSMNLNGKQYTISFGVEKADNGKE